MAHPARQSSRWCCPEACWRRAATSARCARAIGRLARRRAELDAPRPRIGRSAVPCFRVSP
eukprot:1104177-Prorocentrum_minimum.AAC.1